MITPSRRSLAGFLFKALSSPLEKACRLLLVFVVAPGLGPVAFGTYQFATSVTAMLVALAGFGLAPWTTRALARDPGEPQRRSVVAAAVRLRIFAAVPYLVLLAAVAWREDAGDARRAMGILGVGVLAHSFVDLHGAILRGREEFREEATLNAVRALSTTLTAVVAFVLVRSLTGLVVGIALGSLLSAAWSFVTLGRSVRGLNTEGERVEAVTESSGALRSALREAGPLWLTGLLATLYFRTDVLFVRYFTGEHEVGTYSAAYRIFEATMLLPAAVMHVAFPRLARRGSGRGRELLIPLTLGLTGLGGVMALGLVLADDAIVRGILGPMFEQSVAPLRILACAVPVMFASYAVSDFVLARGQERKLVVVLAAMLVLNVALNVFSVPRLGGTGAAWSTLLTELAFVASCIGLLLSDESRAGQTSVVSDGASAR